jgi:hypothetical protein
MIMRLEREFSSLRLTTFCVLLICLHNLAAVKVSKLKGMPFRMSCHVQNNVHTLRFYEEGRLQEQCVVKKIREINLQVLVWLSQVSHFGTRYEV